MQNYTENRLGETTSTSKEQYVKPESEIVKLELEQPILTASAPNFGSGGHWGRD